MGLGAFQAGLFGEQARVQVGEKAFQHFQIAAVGTGFRTLSTQRTQKATS